ncbi:hypothetical protein BGZ50_009617 [Haplosporangium sp. Z 11]|nr:hypothetical protein BGZ50_009617 [Haplosporangium sp. Z 11]
MLRDSDGIRIMPHRIKHFPDVVLDVVLSTNVEHAHAESTMVTPNQTPTHSPTDSRTDHHRPGAVNDMIHISPPSSLPTKGSEKNSLVTAVESVSGLAIAVKPSSDLSLSEPLHFCLVRKSTMQIQEDMKVATDTMIARNRAGKPLNAHSIVEESLPDEYRKSVATLMAAKPGFERTVINKLDGLHDQGLITQEIVRQVLKETQEIKDRLILIERKTEAILTQQLELTEYPIPRLFIVLPEETTKYDPSNWVRTKFRLHFICECGEHTKVTGSRIPNHLHLAKHEGYLIREPTAFFKKYGPFLLLMLELIKFGTNIAGYVVPTLASLKVVELVGSVQQTVELVTAKIDYSLECIDKQLAGDSIDTEPRAAMTQQDLANYLSDVEGLEGVELRQLESFLKKSSEENLLGNLYRMTTSDGHVKWVCRDHYRASYQEKHTQKLRDVVKLAQGEFDEQLGRITITLTSSFAAAEFYKAISKAKGVLELIVDLRWECNRSDLEELEDALKKSGVLILRLDLQRFRTSLRSRLLSTSAQYEGFLRIIELPNTKIIHMVLPKEFVKLSSFQPKRPSHLRKLSFEVVARSIGGKEFGVLAEALKTNSTLTTLDLSSNSIGDNGAQALSEAIKTNSTLITLKLWNNKIGDNGAQALSEALKANSTLATLDLISNSIGEDGAQTLSEALKTNSTLATLDLTSNSIGDNGAQALSEALKTNSTLTTLDLTSNSIGDNGAQALFEALKSNSTLITLKLRGNKIEYEGVLLLILARKINSALTTLDLTSNSIEEDGALALSAALKAISTLTTLDLRRNSIGDNGAQVLSEALKANSTLTTLYLTNNSIGDNGAQALSEALKAISTLTTLDLTSNSIGDNGAQVLSEALKTNLTLTTLHLTSNSIGDNGAQALFEALKANSTLTTLELGCNSIGDNGAQALSEALKANSTLTTLDLTNNSIGEDGAQALSEALKTNLALTTLYLTSNSIGDNGAQALSEALKANSTLTTLSLTSNSIGEDGTQAVSEALKTNLTLTTLYLAGNSIGDNGTQVLSEALKTNLTLTTLGLTSNSIGEDGAQALSEALKTNLALTTLDLRRNSIGDNGAQALFKELKTRGRVRILL